MTHHTIFRGSLTFLLVFFNYSFTILQPLILLYVYVCMCECICVVGTMFCAQIGSKSIQYCCGESSLVHQLTNIIFLEAQDPCYHLGLGIVQNRGLGIVQNRNPLVVCHFFVLIGYHFLIMVYKKIYTNSLFLFLHFSTPNKQK